MSKNRYQSPIFSSVDQARLGFGVEMLQHLDGIRDQIALVGVPAVISLIEAIIADDHHLYREDLADKAKFLCRPDMADTVDDLITFFEGTDPRRHLWSNIGGFYLPLQGPFVDFPN